MRLLIVDDCPTIRAEIRLTLQDLADPILEAADGNAAIESYFVHKPDWVTMDLEMEPVDGFTAIRRIKSCDPAARIVVVTGHDIEEFRKAAKARGVEDYVLKEELWKIREVIASAGSCAGLKEPPDTFAPGADEPPQQPAP